MIKLLKWSVLKEINTLKLIFTALFVLLFICSIAPIKNDLEPPNLYALFIISSKIVIFMSIIFFTIMYPSISLIFELRQPYSLLEKSIPQSFAKILIVRIIVNFFIFLICLCINFIGVKVMNRFYPSYMNLNFELSYIYYLLYFTIFWPLIIHFFYLASVSIPILKIYPIIGTMILTGLFIKISIMLSDYLPHITLIPFQFLITIIAFYGSCLLYEKYYTPK